MTMQNKRLFPHLFEVLERDRVSTGKPLYGFHPKPKSRAGTMQKSGDGLKNFISRCSELLKSCEESTRKILDYAARRELERCDWESQNRDRLIKIIEQEHLEAKKKFAEKINSNPAFFESWEKEFQVFIQKNIQRDADILEILKGERSELQKAIASVYKIRKNIQGYNPHSV